MEENQFETLPEADVVVNFVMRRFLSGLYTAVLVYGLPGTGKSSQCQRLGELIQDKFKERKKDISIYIVDSLLELLRALRKSKPGDVIITEEVSVLFPSRRSMSGENVAIGKLMDTCRKKQIILLANAPLLTAIDSHIKALAHLGIQTLKILKKEKVVVSTPIILQTNPSNGKTYFHKLTRDGYDVDRIFTKMPNAERWAEYESNKDKFMDLLYEKEEAKAKKKHDEEMKSIGKIEKKKAVKPLSKREMEVYDLLYRQRMKKIKIAEMLGVSPPTISAIVKKIQEKTQIF